LLFFNLRIASRESSCKSVRAAGPFSNLQNLLENLPPLVPAFLERNPQRGAARVAVVAAQVAFNLMIPCTLFSNVAKTLSQQPSVSLLAIPLVAVLQVRPGCTPQGSGVQSSRLLAVLPVDLCLEGIVVLSPMEARSRQVHRMAADAAVRHEAGCLPRGVRSPGDCGACPPSHRFTTHKADHKPAWHAFVV
jgi:hypothetical protein